MSSPETTSAARLNSLAGQARSHWQSLGERERLAVLIGGSALALLLLWMLAVQPALRTLQRAPQQLAQADAQLQQMQALAREAAELRALPVVPAAQAQQALQAASTQLGSSARLVVTGDRAVLTLTGVSPEALQAWLLEVRGAARARPVEAKLQRGPNGFTGSIVLAVGAAGA